MKKILLLFMSSFLITSSSFNDSVHHFANIKHNLVNNNHDQFTFSRHLTVNPHRQEIEQYEEHASIYPILQSIYEFHGTTITQQNLFQQFNQDSDIGANFELITTELSRISGTKHRFNSNINFDYGSNYTRRLPRVARNPETVGRERAVFRDYMLSSLGANVIPLVQIIDRRFGASYGQTFSLAFTGISIDRENSDNNLYYFLDGDRGLEVVMNEYNFFQNCILNAIIGVDFGFDFNKAALININQKFQELDLNNNVPLGKAYFSLKLDLTKATGIVDSKQLNYGFSPFMYN